jgi:putative polyketide hydroxylase
MTARIPADADVVVVGAGPVGLCLAGLLGQYGVRTVVLERHPTTSSHPRGFGIHPRTMEVFRRLGVADAIRAAGIPPQEAAGFGFVGRLNGDERARLMLEPMPDRIGPEQGCFCPQHAYEAILRDHASGLAAVDVVFDAEVTGVDGGRVLITDTLTGDATAITGRWVVAADGMHSGVRSLLGSTETTTGAFGHNVSVHLRADLRRFREGRPFAITWTVDPGAQGTFSIAAPDATEWMFTFAGDPALDYSPAELVERVRDGVGDRDLDVDVLGLLRWDYEQAVTDRWRSGPVLFCGDAAHRFPPHGGFGMNSGVQDAENLAWKLAAVLRWGAADRLLDSYEAERKPVAIQNGRRAVINTERLAGADWTPANAASSLEDQREHFLTLGQQMGAMYGSTAVVDDGSPQSLSAITDYVETGRPGARAPYVGFEDRAGRRTSTIDACSSSFLVVTGCAPPPLRTGVPLAVVHVGREWSSVDRTWHEVFGVTPTGAVLIRPDGHVAARYHGDASAVGGAVDAILGRSV